VNSSINLADFLKSAAIHSVLGVPMGAVPDVFLDIILSSNEAAVAITGQAADVANRTEAFFLTQETFRASRWKTRLDDGAAWQAIEPRPVWKDGPFARIFTLQRNVRYYLDPSVRVRGLTPQGPLDSAAALEFADRSGDRTRTVLLYATPDYPCAVELVTRAERVREILATLEEFFPVSIETTLVDIAS